MRFCSAAALQPARLAWTAAASRFAFAARRRIDLLALERWVDPEDRRMGLVALEIVVYPDDDPLPGVDRSLKGECGIGDLALRVAALDRLDHATELVDLREVRVAEFFHPIRQRLDEVRAAERVDRVRHPASRRR